MFVAITTGLAAAMGVFAPLRWGLFGFFGAVLVAFIALFAMLAFRGFEGLPISESLILFEGSMVAYIAFNLQVAYRAFALPLLVLAALYVARARRAAG